MSWPHDLFHFRDVVVLFKDDHVVCLTSRWVLITMIDVMIIVMVTMHVVIILYSSRHHCDYLNFTLPCDCTEVRIVREGDVVSGMPVEAGEQHLYHHLHPCHHCHSQHRRSSPWLSVTTMIKRPVTAHGEGNSVQHVVDWIHHLFSSDGELDMIWWE